MSRVLQDTLREAARDAGAKEAVLQKDKAITYQELYLKSNALAKALIDSGVVKSDRVSFFLEKCFEKVISIYGIPAAGGVFVPIRRLSSGPQVEHILKDSGTKVLITNYARFGALMAFEANLPDLETIIAIGDKAEAGEHWPKRVKVVDWEQVVGKGIAEAPALRVIESDLAAILYTSGSTGKPKGVVLSHLNIMAGARSISEYLKITSEDRILSILTFGFDYGLNQLTTCVMHKAQIVLLEYLFPKDIITNARKYGITGIATVATTWIQLMNIKWNGEDIPTLRYITNSGGAIPENHVRELRTRLPNVSMYLMYGLTEAFRSTFLDPSLVDQFPTSMGKAVPGEEILILDEYGKQVPAGGTGELVHRGVFVAQGYWNAPDLTAIRYKPFPGQPAAVPLREMAVFSGDQVRIEANGLLYFVGRKDEMIKSTGIRISPTEIEEILYASQVVKTAMALGVPDAVLGSVVCAVIVMAEGKEDARAELEAYCKQNMPTYMVPKVWEWRTTLPTNTNGKLDRAMIRDEIQAKYGGKKV